MTGMEGESNDPIRSYPMRGNERRLDKQDENINKSQKSTYSEFIIAQI